MKNDIKHLLLSKQNGDVHVSYITSFFKFKKKKKKRDPNRTSKLSMHHHATVDQNERKLKCKFYVPQSYNIINYAIFGIKFDFSTG